MVIRWKRNLAKFENEQYKSGLASGEFLLVHGYSGDILQVQAENDDVAFVDPAGGHLHRLRRPRDPEGRRRRSPSRTPSSTSCTTPTSPPRTPRFLSYLCPNRAAYEKLGPEVRRNPAIFLDEAVRAKSEIVRDLGADNAKYVKVWDEIKAAR